VLRRRTQTAGILLLMMILSGCGATRPMKYYVLDPGPVPAASGGAQYPVTLLVGRITASHLYRDDRLVYGSGPVQLGVFD
jgi:ABC-type uncharacterized transport system auxiliary subunit